MSSILPCDASAILLLSSIVNMLILSDDVFVFSVGVGSFAKLLNAETKCGK